MYVPGLGLQFFSLWGNYGEKVKSPGFATQIQETFTMSQLLSKRFFKK